MDVNGGKLKRRPKPSPLQQEVVMNLVEPPAAALPVATIAQQFPVMPEHVADEESNRLYETLRKKGIPSIFCGTRPGYSSRAEELLSEVDSLKGSQIAVHLVEEFEDRVAWLIRSRRIFYSTEIPPEIFEPLRKFERVMFDLGRPMETVEWLIAEVAVELLDLFLYFKKWCISPWRLIRDELRSYIYQFGELSRGVFEKTGISFDIERARTLIRLAMVDRAASPAHQAWDERRTGIARRTMMQLDQAATDQNDDLVSHVMRERTAEGKAKKLGQRYSALIMARPSNNDEHAYTKPSQERENLWESRICQYFQRTSGRLRYVLSKECILIEERGAIISIPAEAISANPFDALSKVDALSEAYEDRRLPFPVAFAFCPDEYDILLDAFQMLERYQPLIQNYSAELKEDHSYLDKSRFCFRYDLCPELARHVFPDGDFPVGFSMRKYKTWAHCLRQPFAESYIWRPLSHACDAPLAFCRRIDIKHGNVPNESAYNSFFQNPKAFIMHALELYGRVTPYTIANAIQKFAKLGRANSIELYGEIFKLFRPRKVIQTHALTSAAAVAAAASGVEAFKGFYEAKNVCKKSHEEAKDFIRHVKPRMKVDFIEKDFAKAEIAEIEEGAADLVFFDIPDYMDQLPPECGACPFPFMCEFKPQFGMCPVPEDVLGTKEEWPDQVFLAAEKVASSLRIGGYAISTVKSYSDKYPLELVVHELMEECGLQYVGAILHGHPQEATIPAFVWKKSPPGTFSNPPLEARTH
jgi:hypothetical protein